MQNVSRYTRVQQYEGDTFVQTPNTSAFKYMVGANKEVYITCISSVWKKKLTL
jgi:hypothetical protein